MEESLGELLVLCQHSEEYSQYMLAMLGRGAAPAGASASPTAGPRARDSAKAPSVTARENAFRAGAFCTAVRELVSCYTHLVSSGLVWLWQRPVGPSKGRSSCSHDKWGPFAWLHACAQFLISEDGLLTASHITYLLLYQLFLRCLCGCWLQEQYYLEHNVGKAARIDEWTAEVLTTSVVDDIFFILQKCGARALATGNLQCVCAILGHLNTLLTSNLRASLEHKWKVSGCTSVHQLGGAQASDCFERHSGRACYWRGQLQGGWYTAVLRQGSISRCIHVLPHCLPSLLAP